MYLKIIILGLCLFILLRILNKLITILPLKNNFKLKIKHSFPSFEFIIWLGFVIFVVKKILSYTFVYKPIVISLIIIGLIFFSYFFLKDIIAGLIFKTRYKPEINKSLLLDNFLYKIKEIGFLTILLENKDGDKELIPFFEFRNKKIQQVLISNNYNKHDIEINLKNFADLYTMKEELQKNIQLNYLCIQSKPPVIFSEEIKKDYTRFKIHVFVFKEKHILDIKEYLKQCFKENYIET